MIMPCTMLMACAMFMSVMPQLSFVEQKEKHQASQQCGKQIVGAGLTFKSLRQQVHEGRGQQGARSKAQHMLGIFSQNAKAEYRRQPDATDTSSQGTQNNCY